MFEDVVACCSGITGTQKYLLEKLITMLGGKFSCALTCNVTHLIENNIGSAKHKVSSLKQTNKKNCESEFLFMKKSIFVEKNV